MSRHKHYLGGHTIIYPTSSDEKVVTAGTKIEVRSVAASPISPPKGKMCGLKKDRHGNVYATQPNELQELLRQFEKLLRDEQKLCMLGSQNIVTARYFVTQLHAKIGAPSERYDARAAYFLVAEIRNWMSSDSRIARSVREPSKKGVVADLRRGPVKKRRHKSADMKPPISANVPFLSPSDLVEATSTQKKHLRTRGYAKHVEVEAPRVQTTLSVEDRIYDAMRKGARSDEEAKRRAEALIKSLRESGC